MASSITWEKAEEKKIEDERSLVAAPHLSDANKLIYIGPNCREGRGNAVGMSV